MSDDWVDIGLRVSISVFFVCILFIIVFGTAKYESAVETRLDALETRVTQLERAR